MTDNDTMALVEMLRNGLDGAEPDMLREMVRFMAEGLMSAEADALCGAPYGVRSEERVNHRNGYRQRRWDTRAGTIQLAIPKLRQGCYFPDWLLEHRKRGERALVAVVAESYLRGVSTRKVDAVVRKLGIDGISKSQVSELARDLDAMVEAFRSRPLEAAAYPYVWLDALMVKSREDGRIVNVACVVAIGVRDDGHREVLGVDVITVEDGAGWTALLRSLVARGLKGVQLVTSDAHSGLKDAISVIRGASWQRCRTHFMRNLLTRVPRSARARWRRWCGASSSSPAPRRCGRSTSRSSSNSASGSSGRRRCSRRPGRTSSPSRRSPRSTGVASGATTRWSA